MHESFKTKKDARAADRRVMQATVWQKCEM